MEDPAKIKSGKGQRIIRRQPNRKIPERTRMPNRRTGRALMRAPYLEEKYESQGNVEIKR